MEAHASRGAAPRKRPFRAGPSTHAESWATQLRWFAIALVAGFGIPFVFSSALKLQHDLYLGIYFAGVLSLFGAYASSTRLDIARVARRNWKLGLLLGIVIGFALVRNVLGEKGTPHPQGAYYIFELIWRGGIYGAIDALLLTVLPCLVAYRALGGDLATWRRRISCFVASLALIVTITAVYHLGFTQYRQDGVRQPETGNVLISIPMLLSGNPIGSIADHMAMHMTAVAHTYETDVRLPPPTRVH